MKVISTAQLALLHLQHGAEKRYSDLYKSGFAPDGCDVQYQESFY